MYYHGYFLCHIIANVLRAIAVAKLQLRNNWTLYPMKFYVSRMTYLSTPRSAPEIRLLLTPTRRQFKVRNLLQIEKTS